MQTLSNNRSLSHLRINRKTFGLNSWNGLKGLNLEKVINVYVSYPKF